MNRVPLLRIGGEAEITATGAGPLPAGQRTRQDAARSGGWGRVIVIGSHSVHNAAPMSTTEEHVLTVESLNKVYSGGFQALKDINLRIRRGEIFALLGPNGAGKTTLISIICGIVTPSSGQVRVAGHDIIRNYRSTRSMIGLVPQELTTDSFETVWNTVSFSRGLFGKSPNPAHIEKVLKSLSLWDKKDSMVMTLSGGMKRRLLIAKALSHEPNVLFLDEPTAGVDVSLRKDMWDIVHELKASGVTIILTTHYIEEAEEIADRVGVINNGELILVEEKTQLMQKLGKKQLTLQLSEPLTRLPASLETFNLELVADQQQLVYTFDKGSDRTGITALLDALKAAGIHFSDLQTTQSSLEDIFVDLINGPAKSAAKEKPVKGSSAQ
jgi:ABC-2 type transport system ATP-binding protein